jgi:hypothetical protein
LITGMHFLQGPLFLHAITLLKYMSDIGKIGNVSTLGPRIGLL